MQTPPGESFAKALSPSMGTTQTILNLRALGYERRIAAYNRAFIDRLGEHRGQPINAAKWFNYYSYDVMGDLAFDKDFGILRSGNQHFAVELLKEAMSIHGLKLPTWIFRTLVAISGLTKQY